MYNHLYPRRAAALLWLSMLLGSTLSPTLLYAQTRLYGTTAEGGAGAGTLFSSDPDGSDFQVEYTFPDFGSQPTDRPVMGTDGAFYGVSSEGGAYELGVAYKVMPQGGSMPVALHSFQLQEGQPTSGLTLGPNGNLYGMTTTSFYRLSPDGTLTVLRTFTAPEGLEGQTLLLGSDGYFYGGLRSGGIEGAGSLFRIMPDGTSFQKLHDFSSADGYQPHFALLEHDGFLYGVTQNGSASQGSVFRMTLSGSNFETLAVFDEQYVPAGALTAAANGALYGIAGYTNDAAYPEVYRYTQVYKIMPDGAGFTVLSPEFFGSSTFALFPHAALVVGSDQLLYGAVPNSNDAGRSTIFRVESNDALTTLAQPDFYTFGGLVRGNDGSFYGVTETQFRAETGLYQLSSQGGTAYSANVIASLGAPLGKNSDGQSLLQIGDYLYGTCRDGGQYQYGTFFRYSLQDHTVEKLHDFNNTNAPNDGIFPVGTLVDGQDGYIYGIAVDDQYGQVAPNGIVSTSGVAYLYQIALDGSSYTTLAEVTDDDDNRYEVFWGVIRGSDGFLYTTEGGGGYYGQSFLGNYGLVYRLNTSGSLVDPIGDGISSPGWDMNGLLEASNGYLYYTARSKVGEFGQFTEDDVLMRVKRDNPDGYEVLHDFSTADGLEPFGRLVEGPGSYLYGLTSEGGANGYGTVFRIKLDGTGFQKLYDFTEANGTHPVGNLSLGADQLLYGLTRFGGSHDAGTLFSISLDGATFTKLHDFSALDGSQPRGAVLFLDDASAPEVTLAYEAECAQLGSAWTTSNSSLAANGQFVYGASSAFAPLTDDSQVARFALDVPQAGAYTLAARVRAISSNRNSFWVRLNGGAWERWDLPVSQDYQWAELPFSGQSLSQGTNTVELGIREFNTNFDKLVLTNGALPTGLGPDATNCTVDFSTYLEAECAQVGAAWTTSTSTLAANGQYVYSTASHFSPSGQTADRVRFVIDAPQADAYTISARVRAIGSGRNSFWVRLNDGAWERWDLPVGQDYQWVSLPVSGSALSQGSNTLDVEFRESYTQLDKVFVTNTGAMPTGLGEAATNCDNTRRLSPAAAQLTSHLQVYPNPTQGRFTLTDAELDLSQAQVQVTALDGRLLPQVPVRAQGNGWQIDLSAQPAGLYLIKVTTPQQVLLQRAIKQ
ncbi:Por secretion system C-terminal sorting domain-containing protein [Catalinimonas alkaloidigena]|uniref:Por secretion system C-terminal sorting domain-containing protein n=1 Tax=Catalinimonas alkaloidigena TaxID=1075417 RepID=A0A1G9IHT3_9BACT|nr:choice-of-anchor tandem repeat GloVer-containing protein [Catalinimonas alkaloidigena]SDL24747.1 Por secretion system C-terminal sorting domain-containing protein [Catalinimonas alkaloidigena]